MDGFDAETMTCKLRDYLADSDDPDAKVAEHEKKMSGLSNRKADEYLRLMKKKCPNLDPEETLEKIAAIGDRKLQGDAFRWLMKGAVRLPEDMYKVEEARKLADKAKKDPFSYETPQACVNALQGEFKRGYESNVKPIDPDTVPELSDKKELPCGVTTYLVQDDQKGQRAMRKIIDTHWGKDANPWCLLQGDGQGNLNADAPYYWNHYNALPKRVAFKDGKLLAFMATDTDSSSYNEIRERDWENFFYQYEDEYQNSDFNGSPVLWMEKNHPEEIEEYYRIENAKIPEQWWDRQDASHEGIPLGNIQVPGDEFGRWANFEIRDGKAKQIGGYAKIENDKKIIEWFENGNVSMRVRNGVKYSYFPEGNLRAYSKADKHYIYREDGSVEFVSSNGASYDMSNGEGLTINGRSMKHIGKHWTMRIDGFKVVIDENGDITGIEDEDTITQRTKDYIVREVNAIKSSESFRARETKKDEYIAEAERIYRENPNQQR